MFPWDALRVHFNVSAWRDADAEKLTNTHQLLLPDVLSETHVDAPRKTCVWDCVGPC